MPVTFPVAIDELFGLVQAMWPSSQGLIGYVPRIYWQGQPRDEKVPMDQLWARVSAQNVTEHQVSLSNNNGIRKYNCIGLLYIQLFCPRTDADNTKYRVFADFLRNGFRTDSPSGNIWFTNQRIVELPATDENQPIHVVATYNYDSLNS